MSDKSIQMAKEAEMATEIDGVFTTNTIALSRFRDICLEESAVVCLEISADKWAEYKGRNPYPKDNPNRANPHTEGLSDGAEDCAFAIRAMKEKP